MTKLPHKLEALSLLGKAVAVGIGGKEFPLSAGYFLAQPSARFEGMETAARRI